MNKIYCNISGRKYICVICKDYITFKDAKDKDSFLTVDKSTKLSKVLKHPFFGRTTYN